MQRKLKGIYGLSYNFYDACYKFYGKLFNRIQTTIIAFNGNEPFIKCFNYTIYLEIAIFIGFTSIFYIESER